MMRRSAQRGVVLLIALVVMVAMTLAAIGLVRSVDAGIMAAANLAFRQSATMAGERGVRDAITWLANNSSGASLYADQLSSSSAYWSNAQSTAPAFNPLTYAWGGANQSVCIDTCTPDAAGNTIRYVIHRLCDTGGNPLGVKCIRPAANTGSTDNSSKGAVSSGSLPVQASSSAYYRVTVRVTGPRNTTSYLQITIY